MLVADFLFRWPTIALLDSLYDGRDKAIGFIAPFKEWLSGLLTHTESFRDRPRLSNFTKVALKVSIFDFDFDFDIY